MPQEKSSLKFVGPKSQAAFPNNCPVSERDGDGRPVGRCWFYMKDGVCPRHGAVQTDLQKRISKIHPA